MAYSYSKSIIIDHTKVGENLTDFPFYFGGIFPQLRSVANGGLVQSASGYDIIFAANADGSSPLSFERVLWDATTGHCEFWVKIPSVSTSSDTTIYILFGDSGVSSDQQNASDTWSNGYAVVVHFGTPTTLSSSESLGLSVSNTSVVAAQGKLSGGAGYFNGSAYLRITSNASFKPTAALTLQAIVKPYTYGSWDKIICLDYRGDGSWNSPFAAYALCLTNNTLGLTTHITFGGSITAPNAGTLTNKVWNFVAGVYSGSQIINYVNGAGQSPTSKSGSIDYGTSLDLCIGGRSPYTTGEPFRGYIDEVRVSTVARSPNWMAAEYANQNSLLTFITTELSSPAYELTTCDLPLISDDPYFDPDPVNLRDIEENFDSDDGQFTKYTESSAGTTSIAANQYTVTHVGGKSDIVTLNTSSLIMPQAFVQIQVDARTSTATGWDVINVGIAKDEDNFIMLSMDYLADPRARIQYKIAGSTTWKGLTGLVAPTAPYKLAMSIVANSVCFWIDTGAGWEYVSKNDDLVYDLRTDGNLTDWKAAFSVYNQGGNCEYKFSNFKIGRFGGVGMRDMSIVTEEDGSPHIIDSTKVQFLATVADPTGFHLSGGSANGCYCGVFTLDLSDNSIVQDAAIMVSRSSKTYPDHAGQIIRCDNGDQILLLSNWGSSWGAAVPQILYKRLTTGDILSGTNVVSSMTQLALPEVYAGMGAYDPYAVYDSNLSKWLFTYTIHTGGAETYPFFPAAAWSADLSSFTSIAADIAYLGWEGGKICPADDGLYYIIVGGPAGSGNSSRLYDSTMKYVGLLDLVLEGGADTQPHLMAFPFNGSFVILTFDNTRFADTNTVFSWGQPQIYGVYTAPLSASLNDSLAILFDSISTSAQAMNVVFISDALLPVSDLIHPPPVKATHFDGILNDTLPIISDVLSILINHTYNASVSDTLEVIQDSIAAAGINLETPARWVAPISITPRVDTLDPLYLAAHPVLHPTWYFEPRVKSYGVFTRAISAPAGFVKTGDVNISLVDSDNSIRQRIAAKTIRKATAEIRLGPEGGSYSAFLRPCKREVGTPTQGPDGELNLPLRDFVFDFLEEQIPAEIDTDRYPNLPESPTRDFAPIIIGTVTAAYGAIPLFLVDEVTHGYMVARHPCLSIDAVYRKRSDEDVFTLVGAGEYTLSNLEDYTNNRFYCQILFSADQADAEIRANVTGYYYSDTLALRCTNFADFILEVFQTILGVDGGDKVNFSSFDTVRTATAADGLACSGVLFEKMTFGECLSQLQRSSNIDIFTDKNDRITVHYTTDDEEPTVHLDDVLRLYKGTVSQSLADPAYNQVPYKYAQNYATGKWTEDTWDNEGDQEKLGEVVPEEPLQLYWVRDAATALAVVERRAQYLDLDSFRFEAEIPLIPVVSQLELADLVTIEHFGGIKVGGYLAEQFKILELGMTVDNLKYRVKGIRRRLPPSSYIETPFDDDDDGGEGGTDVGDGINGVLAVNCRPGPFYNGIEGELFAIWRDRPDASKLKAWVTDDFGAAWRTVDIASQPNLSNTITSFDCVKIDGEIHIATQENNGRLAYHIFDMSSRTWTTVDEQIKATSNTNNPCVSIEARNPGGEIVVYFQGDRILYSGTLWERGYYTMLSGGSWTAPVQVTPEPQDTDASGGLPWYWLPNASASRHCFINRVVPGRVNRMHFFYQYDEMMMFKPPEIARTMQSDRTFTARVYLQGVGWLYWPATRNLGGTHIAAVDGYTRIIAVRRRSWGNLGIHTYAEGETLSVVHAPEWDGISVSFSLQTGNPCGYIAEIDGRIHAVISLGSQVTYNYTDNNGSSWAGFLRASPVLSDGFWRYPTRDCNGDVIKIRGKKYLAYFADQYRWICTDELPLT